MAGNPTVVLFDISSASGNLNSWKHELYEKAQIGIPHLDIECNDLIILGFMMAQFIADFRWQITQGEEKEAKVVAIVTFKTRFTSFERRKTPLYCLFTFVICPFFPQLSGRR